MLGSLELDATFHPTDHLTVLPASVGASGRLTPMLLLSRSPPERKVLVLAAGGARPGNTMPFGRPRPPERATGPGAGAAVVASSVCRAV